jgi:hypothetical protein
MRHYHTAFRAKVATNAYQTTGLLGLTKATPARAAIAARNAAAQP